MQPYACFGWCMYAEAVASCMCACISGAINDIF